MSLLLEWPWKNLAAHIRADQPILVLGEGGMVPDRLIQSHADEPAKQDAVADLLHQQAVAANRVERLQKQELSASRSGGIEGRPVCEYIWLKSLERLHQGLIHHGPDRDERDGPWEQRLSGEV